MRNVWRIFAGLTMVALAVSAEEVSKPVTFTRPERPFMLVSPEELATAKAKIETQPWAKDCLKQLCTQADEIIADPQFFPESEGGWSHKYVSPKTAEKLQFDPKSPHHHFDPSTGEYLTGKDYDDAWNLRAVHVTAEQQEVLAAAWVLTQNKRYIETMRTVFLDIAKKYPTYHLHDKSMELLPIDEPMGTNAPTGGFATAQSIDECNAFTSLAFSYDTLAGSGALSASEQAQIEEKVWKPLHAYMRRLMELHPSGGNWWIWHSSGAIVVGVLMGDEELVNQGFNAPKCGLFPHLNSGYINEDGFTAELSPSYHAYPFKALLRLAIASRRVGIDFYKEERFRKAFDLPLTIRQPTLYMPRLNDGWYTTITDSFFASLYENAASWYADPIYGKTLVSIYSSTNPVVERDSVSALLYGPAELPKEGLGAPEESAFLKASGLAILRTSGNDWNAALKNDLGVSGHRHPDALNLVLFANGEEVFPGTGSPSYGHSSYRQWFSQTIAHNTVTLNQNSQRVFPWGKTLEWGYSGAGISVVQSHASSKALQDDPHRLTNATPIQLRRTLVLLPSCIVDFVRVSEDKKPDSPSGEFPETIADLALHLNGNLSMEGEWNAWNEPLISKDRKLPGAVAPNQGYDLLQDVRQAVDPSQVRGRLRQKNGGGVDLWFSAAPDKGTIFTATGLGLPGSVDERMPMILQRRQTNETVFAAVYAPWKEVAQVEQVSLPSVIYPGAIAKIKHIDGVDLVVSLPESGTVSVDGITLKGTIAARSEVKGGQKIMLIGQSLQLGNFSIELESAGAVLFESSEGVERLSNVGNAGVKGFIETATASDRTSFELKAAETIVVSPQQPKLLKSNLTEADKEAVLFTDVNGDGSPDILESWWNGKRCRWFDENGDMKKTDLRGDMVGDSMQVDIGGDGFYDGPSDMNINWVDNDGDGQADLMCVAMNPNAKQKELWGESSHYMHFLDLDSDGVNHFIDWNEGFNFHAWQHTGGCNFSPDYNGNSIFIKTHLPPWTLTDPRFNWENPFAFYDFDNDGCTEMTVRYLNHHKMEGQTHNYSGVAEAVQMGFDLDNDSQRGQEQSFDMSLGFDGPGVDYRNRVNKFPGQKAPAWVLPYYQHTNYREIDELIFMPHELCFDEAMRGKWDKVKFVFDEDGDDHRWERVEFYEPGDPYLPRPPKGEKNDSVVRGVQTDTLGDRAEWDQDFSGGGKLYIGPWDNKLHLYGAESGVWLFDDGSYFGSGSAPRACSPDIAPNVKEVVQYKDTDSDGFFDLITYDYDGDKIIDLEVSLLEYGIKAPELIDPAQVKWQGLHETFKAMAKQSWDDAQRLYRAAWKAGLTDAELDDLAIASSTWEKYHHGYWLKEKLFRKLYNRVEGNKKDELKRAYFSGDFTAFGRLISGMQ